MIAAAEEQLPAACTTVVHVRQDAAGTVCRPGKRTKVEDVVLAGITVETAQTCAADLARFDDRSCRCPAARCRGWAGCRRCWTSTR